MGTAWRSAAGLALAITVAGSTLVLDAAFSPAAAQQLARVDASEFSLSRETAVLRLDLAGGESIEAAIRDGIAFINGERVGDAPRGGELDRAWRDLLNEGMDLSSAELPALLAGWSAPGTVGAAMAERLREALATAVMDDPDAAAAVPAVTGDTVDRLLSRIDRLEREREQAERNAAQAERRAARAEQVPTRTRARGPLHHVWAGVQGVLSLMITYVVLFGIAFVAIFFGARKYIEGVADTARNAAGRSMLVGLAGGFLVVPTFILGMIALVISIVGIPALLVWVPLFPVAVAVALMLGYIGVAHAAGEALAERRFYVTDWFQRGNSYYFLMTGLGLLLAFFFAAQVVRMAGSWATFLQGLLAFIGGAITFFALCTGFGAVLLSRAGTRPIRARGYVEDHEDVFREEANV